MASVKSEGEKLTSSIKRKRQRWRRWFALVLSVLFVLLFVLTSNRFLYLSHQRFPVLTWVQWNHVRHSEDRAERPTIIGHRGSALRSTNPSATSVNKLIGNTRNAIQAAIDADVDWIEIDIRVSLDRELVVFHDSIIDSKTNKDGSVEEMALRELQVCEVRVDPPEQMLSLKQVLKEFHSDQRQWVLDIKADGISQSVSTCLEEAGVPKAQVTIFGVHHLLKAYRNQGYRLGYTTLFRTHRSMFLSKSTVLERCHNNGYKLLVVPIVFVTPQFVTRAEATGLEVWSYDSNDPRDLRYCVDCGVSGLIVDFPDSVNLQFHNGKE